MHKFKRRTNLDRRIIAGESFLKKPALRIAVKWAVRYETGQLDMVIYVGIRFYPCLFLAGAGGGLGIRICHCICTFPFLLNLSIISTPLGVVVAASVVFVVLVVVRGLVY